MTSERFSLNQSDIPSIIRSVGVSVGAILTSLAVTFLLGFSFPDADLSTIKTVILTGSMGFIVNLIQRFVREI